MRTLAIDFGEKRVGLALSDPLGRLALPFETLGRTSDRQLVRQIAGIVEREEVSRLVVGQPVNLDGSLGPAAERVESFRRKLERGTGLRCELVNESLTSVEAERRLREAGVDPRRHPERVDAVAAQILLEQALAPEAGGQDG